MIDYLISTNLGAWQVGDVEKLHATYGDDVTIVQAPALPPVVGWNNYLPLYQRSMHGCNKFGWIVRIRW